MLRAARLGGLAQDFAEEERLPAEYGPFIASSLRSTLEDCARLEVYREAVVLALGQETPEP